MVDLICWMSGFVHSPKRCLIVSFSFPQQGQSPLFVTFSYFLLKNVFSVLYLLLFDFSADTNLSIFSQVGSPPCIILIICFFSSSKVNNFVLMIDELSLLILPLYLIK